MKSQLSASLWLHGMGRHDKSLQTDEIFHTKNEWSRACVHVTIA
jgi:hypothetical protein